jgi:hypothetical protein
MLSLCRRTLLASLLALFAGCVSERDDCEPFNHPAYQQWWLGPAGTVVRFTNEAGRTYSITVEKVEVIDGARGESGTCERYALHSLRGGDEHRFSLSFAQEIGTNAPLDQQRLAMFFTSGLLIQQANTYFIVSPVGDPLNVRVLAESGDVHTYSPTRTIRGVTYTDVLEVTTPPGHPTRTPPAGKFDNTWVRVAVARSVGLLQYELADGQVFTRVP